MNYPQPKILEVQQAPTYYVTVPGIKLPVKCRNINYVFKGLTENLEATCYGDDGVIMWFAGNVIKANVPVFVTVDRHFFKAGANVTLIYNI